MDQYLEATEQSGKQFYQDFNAKGKVVMLNLLKFRKKADYKGQEALKPEQEISGEEAYQLYMDSTQPVLKKAGSRILYYGRSNRYLIGPVAETWDAILLVEHSSVSNFMEFAQSEAYLENAGHRIAALEDSRLLPTNQIYNGA